MLLGVCDGVSQLEDFGMDSSALPKELLQVLEELAMSQLMPDGPVSPQDAYRGPVALLKEAYEATENLGSTTVLLAVLDNSTRIHGKLHPMIAVLSIGDCELVILRRESRQQPFEAVFRTEMQRIDGHCQAPLQLARVDERIDPDFDESIALEVIERGSAVHCVSVYEGDVIVLGSDGVFDNLFLEEITQIVNSTLKPQRGSGGFKAIHPDRLTAAATRIIEAAHRKTDEDPVFGYAGTPIGRYGKIDDTSCVVGEVVEWTQAHREILAQVRRNQRWKAMMPFGGIQCGPVCGPVQCGRRDADSDEDASPKKSARTRSRHQAHMPPSRMASVDTEQSEDEDDGRCVIA